MNGNATSIPVCWLAIRNVSRVASFATKNDRGTATYPTVARRHRSRFSAAAADADRDAERKLKLPGARRKRFSEFIEQLPRDKVELRMRQPALRDRERPHVT
jgi:hypothetical protein